MLTPAEQLVELLAADRRRGVAFEDAWARRLAAVLAELRGQERVEWRYAFTDVEDEWRSAYLRRAGINSQLGELEIA